jgi:hypothetical protein
MSYLGPFFAVSVLYDDDHKLADQFFTGQALVDSSTNTTLQHELESTRVNLVTLIHNHLNRKLYIKIVFLRLHFTKRYMVF